MKNILKLTHNDFYHIVVKNKIKVPDLMLLESAFNDWPTDEKTIGGYFDAWESYLKSKNFEIENLLKETPDFDFSTDAWHAESLSSLQEFMIKTRSKNIKEIVELIENKLNKLVTE